MILPRRLTSSMVAIALASIGGCSPQSPPPAAAPPLPEAVTHQSFHELLARYVSEDGRVAYEEWSHHPEDVAALDRYVEQLAETSPKSFPHLFPSSSDRLSYWINLYNALVMRAVLRRWPLATVDEVRIDAPRFDVPGRGLLHDLTFVVSGQRMTLLEIEREITRDRMSDARTHFAISCGTRSCPLLPAHPFDPRMLDQQLDRATRRFVNDSNHVKVDRDNQRVVLSPIFRWYERDFARFVADRTSHPAPGVVDFLLLFAEDELADALEEASHQDFALAYRPYDWSFSFDEAGGSAPPPPNDAATEVALAVGERMPRYVFRGLDGEPWDITMASGKVVLIDFWATYCRPCLASFPELEQLQEELGRERFLVVAIAEDDELAPIRAFAKDTSTTLSLAHDVDHLAAEPPLAIERLPTELLIDGEGVIRYRFEGLDDPPIRRIAERAREMVERNAPASPSRAAQAP